MATKGAETRSRLVDSMLDSIQRRGYAGTGLNAMVDQAHAPKGSLYFHFPGGKEALGVAAVERAALQFRGVVTGAVLKEQTAAGAVGRVLEALAELLTASDFSLGCPVSVVTLEAGVESQPLRDSCAAAFESWIEAVTEHLIAEGREQEDARILATTIVSAVEGAIILSRAQRSIAPLTCVERVLASLLHEETLHPSPGGAS